MSPELYTTGVQDGIYIRNLYLSEIQEVAENKLSAVSYKVTIKNSLGLHMRPVARFVDLAKQFDASIQVRKGDYIANGKDSMAMMLLEATKGTELELNAEGADADRAIDALVRLVDNKFGEE